MRAYEGLHGAVSKLFSLSTEFWCKEFGLAGGDVMFFSGERSARIATVGPPLVRVIGGCSEAPTDLVVVIGVR